jgi:DNA-binding FadR family transcriptional regulator
LVAQLRIITRRAAYFVPPGRYVESLDEHEGIYRALQQRDPTSARTLMGAHIAAARERMVGEV